MAYNRENVFVKIRELGLPAGQYVAVGGATLAARGIRETKDLDVIVLPELFEQLSQVREIDAEYQRKWNRKRLKKDGVEIYPDLYLERANIFIDVEKFIADADIIDGIPFQKLDHLIICKLDTAREKDLHDIALIREYLQFLQNKHQISRSI